MPSLLFVNNSPEPGRANAKLGGGGHSALLIIKGLREMGWRVEVAVPADGPFTESARSLNVPIHYYPFDDLSLKAPIKSIDTTRRWTKLLKASRPDLISLNHLGLIRKLGWAALATRTPFVVHVRFPFSMEEYSWCSRMMPTPRMMIFNSHSLKTDCQKIMQQSGGYTTSLAVLHNAVDLNAFTFTPIDLENPSPVVGIFANFIPVKNHEEFLQAAFLVHQKLPEVVFHVIGTDTWESGRDQKLRSLVKECHADEYIRFLGHRSDVPELMSKCTLTVLTSKFESFGRVLIESMACGRPVIAPAVGGIPEVIEDGRSGYLYLSGHPEELASRIVQLLQDRKLLLRMGEYARQQAVSRFSSEQHIEKLHKLYRDALEHNHSGSSVK